MMKWLLVLGFFVIAQMAAADCPSLTNKTIRWVVPNKPGGGYDAYSRLLQPFMEQQLDVRIVMENRFEAGGVVGAMAIRDAPADGLTLGIINAPGLLAASMMVEGSAPDPAKDFTIIGRVSTNHVVLFTGRDSGISDLDELLQISRTRPILVGVRDAGSSNFIALPVTAALLGLDYAVVTGYVGNSARTMAVLRGEVDIVFHNIDSALRYAEAGELIPLLQVTDPSGKDLSDSARKLLATVPVLAGMDGIAQRQSGVSGKSKEQAGHEATALANIFAAGRLVVAPPELPGPLSDCLGLAFSGVIKSAEFLSAAKRANLRIEFADQQAVSVDISIASQELSQFEPLILTAIKRARQ